MHASLRLIPADYPLQFVAIDVLGPFLANDQGNKFILYVVDMHRYPILRNAGSP